MSNWGTQLGNPHGGPTVPQVGPVEWSEEDQRRGRRGVRLGWTLLPAGRRGGATSGPPRAWSPAPQVPPHPIPRPSTTPSNLSSPSPAAGTSGTTLGLTEVSSSLCSCFWSLAAGGLVSVPKACPGGGHSGAERASPRAHRKIPRLGKASLEPQITAEPSLS